MTPLSAVIITYNEETNISRCLDSVKTLADEIVIVDSFSTDRTKEICLQYGAIFLQHPFAGYGSQKNFALSHASNDFILSLDADEVLDETLATSIAQAKQEDFPYDGYKMNRCANYCGKWIRHGLWYPDKKLRLFNRKKIQWNNEMIHEKPVPFQKVKLKNLRGDILHYSYNSIQQHILQNEKFSSISADSLYQQGKRANPLKIILSPAWAFINGYFLRLGFLDGYYGWVIAVKASQLAFLKHSKLYQKQKKK